MRIIPAPWLFWAQATALTPTLIWIRPEREHDAALIEHERTHCRQMRSEGTARFWWKYLTSRNFRLDAEVQAYRVQIAMAPYLLNGCADNLSSWRYALGISYEEARALLSS